jgi:hypothetical protein
MGFTIFIDIEHTSLLITSEANTMIAHVVYIVVLLFIYQIKRSIILSIVSYVQEKIVLTYMYKIVYVGGGVSLGPIFVLLSLATTKTQR